MSSALKKEATPSFFESLYVKLTADANEIVDGLYLGAAAAGQDGKAMQKRRISHVLICHPTLKEFHPKYFKYGRAPLADEPHQNLLEHLPDALEFLGKARKAGGRVFVCCMKGISRSSSVVCAWLMVERGMRFEEAFKACEQKRPVVYPNVGFQQQLRHLDRLISEAGPSASWEERLRHVRKHVPSGPLDGPSAPLRIRDAIGDSMGAELDEAEALAEKVFAKPNLLQQRELWKRHGLFFENFHKYKALPSDAALLDRAKAVMERLRALPKVYSDSLKGVKLALAVASEIESWAKFAEPALANVNTTLPPTIGGDGRVVGRQPDAAGVAEGDDASSTASDASSTASSAAAKKGKKDKHQEKKSKEKLSKKEKKKLKKQKKLNKKVEKAARKANKQAEKIARAAAEADKASAGRLRQAEEAAERAAAIEAEVAAEEAREAARKRPRKDRDQDENGSGQKNASPSSFVDRGRGPPPERRPAAEAYNDL